MPRNLEHNDRARTWMPSSRAMLVTAILPLVGALAFSGTANAVPLGIGDTGPISVSPTRSPLVVDSQRIPDNDGIPPGPELEPPPPGDEDPDPGSYTGGFGGSTVVTVADRFRLRPFGAPSESAPVDSFNVKDGLEAAWNLGKRALETQVAEQVEAESDGKLYNVTGTFATADAASLLNLSVSPKNKTVSLFYMVGGNQLRGKVDAPWVSDPKFKMDFTVGVALNLSTAGSPDEPLELKSAQARLMSVDVDVDGNWTYTVGKAVRWLKNLGNVRGVEETIATSFAGRSSDISSSIDTPVTILNNRLAPLMRQHAASGMTPRYDSGNHRLVLRLDKASPVLAKDAQIAIG